MGVNKSYAVMLAEMSNAMNGAVNSEEIMSCLENYGYSIERINSEGIQPLADVNRLFAMQQKEYGEQYDANAAAMQLVDVVRTEYMEHLRIGRIALKGFPGALHSVSASGSRSRSITGFLKEARGFYINMLDQPRLQEAMARFNVSAEKLEAGLRRVEEVEKAYQAFLKEKGEAQDATIVRDTAFDQLYGWYSDFRAIARIALAGRPQLLEQMGFVVKR